MDTTPASINPAGTVTGRYSAGGRTLGFIRAADGTITTFQVPGAVEVYPLSINPSGSVVGYYRLSVFWQSHGFLRDADGTTTTIDVPDAPGKSTFPKSIDSSGVITGDFGASYYSGDHGFVRNKKGVFTALSVPGAISTSVASINPAGTVTESLYDGAKTHGFLRAADETITTFDSPAPAELPYARVAITPSSINPGGELLGSYWGPSSGDVGFIRASDGTSTTFCHAPYFGTTSINPAGTVTGSSGLSCSWSSFVRIADGSLTWFAIQEENGRPKPTFAEGINPAGTTAGWYLDEAVPTRSHGFVRTAH